MFTHVERGRFIVFDGGEGAGKGTVLKELEKHFPPPKTIFTREPGGTKFAEKIRDVILCEDASEADANTLFALYWAARADHITNLIGPALLRGVNVVSDRFDSSTFAYQIWAQEGFHLRLLFDQLRATFCGIHVPYMYIYLDLDPAIGLERIKGRRAQDHMERRKLEFHQKVREGYHQFVDKYNGHIINANRPIEELVAECVRVVHNALD